MFIPMRNLMFTGIAASQIGGAVAAILAVMLTLRTERVRRPDLSDILALSFVIWGMASLFWAEYALKINRRRQKNC